MAKIESVRQAVDLWESLWCGENAHSLAAFFNLPGSLTDYDDFMIGASCKKAVIFLREWADALDGD